MQLKQIVCNRYKKTKKRRKNRPSGSSSRKVQAQLADQPERLQTVCVCLCAWVCVCVYCFALLYPCPLASKLARLHETFPHIIIHVKLAPVSSLALGACTLGRQTRVWLCFIHSFMHSCHQLVIRSFII